MTAQDEPAIVARAKEAIRHHVRDEIECKYKLSACIEEQLGIRFDTVSRIFSQKEGMTIQHYHIVQRVEYVKELIQRGGLLLEVIAEMTGFSNGAHLSRHFKAITGEPPSAYARRIAE